MLTTATFQRQPLFKNIYLGRIVVNAMRYHDQRNDVETLAYVVMPDHIHWLIQLNDCSLASLVRQFKGFSARKINQYCCISGRSIWQPGYHDHAVRRDEDLQVLARYIIANPLRAGLVSHVEDYPLWDAIWLG